MTGPQYEVAREVSRVVEDPKGVYEVAAAITMILSIPQAAAYRADALYVLPGQGEVWREVAAIRDWQDSFAGRARRLIIAGSYGHEDTWEQPTLARYQAEPFGLTRLQGVILHDHAHHTAEQAAQMVTDVRTEGLDSIALYASPYHLTRAFMTFVAALYKPGAGLIPIIPVPTPVSPATVVPETNLNAWQLLPGELTRIATYQPTGDVASYPLLCEYLEWLWLQPILQGVRAQ